MPKRGENIFKRKSGLWEARYVKGLDECGKKKYGSVYAHTYREAKLKRIEVESKLMLQPQEASSKRMILSVLVEEWLYISKGRLKQSSLQKYTGIYRTHIVNQIGNCLVSQLKPVIFSQYAQVKLNEGLSESTVNNILVLIHSSLKYGKRQYGLPMPEIIYVKPRKKEMRVLSVAEQRSLTAYLLQDMDSYKLGMLVALYTGVRIGELCALRWDDLRDGIMRINKTVQRLNKADTQGTELIVSEPKTTSSIREVPLPQFLVEYVERFRQDGAKHFLGRPGLPVVEPRVLQYQFKKCLKVCGIKDANFHSLRHTFATRCVEQGVDLKTLSVLLGHSDVSVTANKYVHSSLEQKKACMSKLELVV